MRYTITIYRPALVAPVRMGVQLQAVLDGDQARFAIRKPITAPVQQVTLSVGADYAPQMTLPGGADVGLVIQLRHTNSDDEVLLRLSIPGELEWAAVLVPADQLILEATPTP